MVEVDFELRQVTKGDFEYLCGLYATTREYEMARVAWSDAEKAAFLHQQAEAQWQHYQLRYPAEGHSLVIMGGLPVGRLFVERTAKEILIVDFTLDSAWRGLGLGAKVIGTLQEEATAAGKSIGGHVEVWNPARRFWQRMGFVESKEDEVYHRLDWRPA